MKQKKKAMLALVNGVIESGLAIGPPRCITTTPKLTVVNLLKISRLVQRSKTYILWEIR